MSPASHILPYQQPQGDLVDHPRLPVQNETIPLHSVVRCCRLVVHFLGFKSVKVTVLGWGDKWFRYSGNSAANILLHKGCSQLNDQNWSNDIKCICIMPTTLITLKQKWACGTNMFHTSITYPPRTNIEPSLQNLRPSYVANNGRICHRQGVTNNLSRRRPVKNFNLSWSVLTVFNRKWRDKCLAKQKVRPGDRRMTKGKS